jgi:hypothetical protein
MMYIYYIFELQIKITLTIIGTHAPELTNET